MSVKHLALVADITTVSPTCKLVLYGLSIHADSDGNAALSYSEMRKATGLSDRAIRTTIRKLESYGLLRQGNAGCLFLSDHVMRERAEA
jgi:DNA-binding transcriptional regulator PaaX